MGYTNSPLVSYTCLSPNHSGYRGDQGITRITPHCVVGQCTVETLGNIFLPSSRQASSNYGIGYDGRIAMYVEEKNRSWCSGGSLNVNGRTGSQNDYHSVTIEVASDSTEPYAFKTAAYNALVDLCVDICKRNGKNKIIWIDNAAQAEKYWDTMPKNEMLLTVHRWYANKSCPGAWMYARMGDLASKVNARLGSSSSQPSVTPAKNTNFPAVPFLVNVIIPDLNYRSEGSMNGTVKGQTGKGIFTIMEVKNGWGRLKSGVGWIYLENPEYCTIGKHVDEPVTPAPSTPSTPSEAPTTKPEDNMQAIWDALKKAIGNEYGVAGVMGNIHAESAYRPENLQNTFEKSLGMTDAQYTAAVDNGSYSKDKFVNDKAGYGLVQWTYYTRKQAMYEYIKGQKKSIGDLTAQLEFLVKELKGYTKVWDVITKAKSIREASDIVLTQFERPADMGESVQKKRAEYGQQAYDKFHKGDSTPAHTVEGLKKGDKGDAVKEMQKMLIALGYDCGSAGVDGDFGDNTEAALKAFQKDKGLTVDGVYGAKSKAALEKAYKEKPAPVSGGRAKMVAQAQKWLGIKEPNHDEIIAVYNQYLSKAVARGTRNIKANKDYAWCCIFASACACASGNFDYYPVEMSCGKDIELAQKMGIWEENDAYVPSPGDLILFDWDESSASGDNKAWPDHIGVVEKVENGYVITIEGNYSNMVKRRTNLKINGKYIRGYIVPKLDGTTPAPAPQPDEPVKWYRVRKSWADAKSQVGAYKVLNNAKKKADEMGSEYAVFDYTGKEVYRKASQKVVKATGYAYAFDKSRTGTYVVTDDLNLRHGAGTNNSIMVVMPKGTKVQNYGYYTNVSGTDWYFVVAVVGGVEYHGHCSGKYLKKA